MLSGHCISSLGMRVSLSVDMQLSSRPARGGGGAGGGQNTWGPDWFGGSKS